jgi:putative ABC transport system ATP-binding protein
MLSLNHIKKSFHQNTLNEIQLFDTLELNINNNDFVVVVGSNGSGKSTLLNLIDGSLDVDDGVISFLEEDITSTPAHHRSQFISRVHQDPSQGTAPSLTILENMSLALAKGKTFGFKPGVDLNNIEEIKQLLSLLELDLENKLDVKVGLLSGGQRQALSLLMAVCSKPKLLLLDEHTAALDPKASEHIMKLTNKLIKEFSMTTIMITHQLKDALDYGNRCIMFHLGDIVMDVSGEEKDKIQPLELVSLFHKLAI